MATRRARPAAARIGNPKMKMIGMIGYVLLLSMAICSTCCYGNKVKSHWNDEGGRSSTVDDGRRYQEDQRSIAEREATRTYEGDKKEKMDATPEEKRELVGKRGITMSKHIVGTEISAKASSVYQNNEAKWGAQLSWIGGSTKSTGYFHSKDQNNPWLILELHPIEISGVTIINRKDCCGERLKNIEVRAGMLLPYFTKNEVVGYFKGPGATGGMYAIPFGKSIMVKYITFQKMERGILQINGIRLNRAVISAKASSVYQNNIANWGPELAWIGGSSTRIGYFHSKYENNPWLILKLSPIEISGVTIINRKDCCGERLKNLQIRAGMSPGLHNELVGNFHGPGSTGGEHVIDFGAKVKVEYISFQIMGVGWLQINGIRVIRK